MNASLKLCALSLFGLGSAVAQSPALTITDPLAFNNGVGYSLGYSFSSSTAFTVTALGYYDAGTLSEQHDVGIYSTGGTLLTSAIIGPTNGTPTDQFSYTTLFIPITLAAGTYEIMGDTGLVDAYAFDPATFSTQPNITLLADAYTTGNTLAFGTNTESELGYFGANFLETTAVSRNTSVTPEPRSLVLLGTGLIGVATMIRRRLSK